MFVLLFHNVVQLIVSLICMFCVGSFDESCSDSVKMCSCLMCCARMKDKIIIVYALMYVHTVFMYLFFCLYKL